MTTLFDAARPVKASRNFGAGLLRSLPTTREPYTQADLDWLAADNALREAEDAMFDLLAAESAAMDAMEAGLIPADVAGSLMASSIIGHDA